MKTVALLSAFATLMTATAAQAQTTPAEWAEAAARTQAEGDTTGTVTALIGMMRADGFEAHMLPGEPIYRLATVFIPRTEEGDRDRSRLIDALAAANWRSKYASELWLWRATSLVEAGDQQATAAMLSSITEPKQRMALIVDRRFDSFRNSHPDVFDASSALASDLEELRSAALMPNAGLVEARRYAWSLMQRGRADEAIAVITPALDMAQNPRRQELVWALDVLARSLEDLGRHDEALAVRRKAAYPTGDAVSTSNLINVALQLIRLDRPAEALEELQQADTSQLSAYGKMQLAEARACAQHALGQSAAFKSSLDYIVENRSTHPGGREAVAACEGDVDIGVNAYLERLENPEERGEALLEAQTYIVPDENLLTPGAVRNLEYSRAILANPRVRESVDRYGRVVSFPVTDPPLYF